MDGIGIQCIGIRSIALATMSWRDARPGKGKRSAGVFHYNPVNATIYPEVKTMPKCVTCGAQLEPPVCTPHTVYVKTLYRIAGQDYCRHHIIRAVVAAGVITEVKASAGPAVSIPREDLPSREMVCAHHAASASDEAVRTGPQTLENRSSPALDRLVG